MVNRLWRRYPLILLCRMRGVRMPNPTNTREKKLKNNMNTRMMAVAVLTLVGMGLSAGQPSTTPPDLTQTGEIAKTDHIYTYNLGSTGMRGWIFTHANNNLDGGQGRTTAASRQILVTHVGVKSPADGVMRVDDVILGVNGSPFTDDARKSIAHAIQEAEKASNQGILKLMCWRAGKTENVAIKLRVMGTYADSAPYDCPKSKLIFEEACKALEKEPLNANWCGAVNGLALLATGRPEYLPKVKELAQKYVQATIKMGSTQVGSWSGYDGIFLCEYYLATGDKSVLDAIRFYTLSFAKGQSLYGTFGHGFSDLTPDGKLHGSIPPYGPVNAAGLVANIAIVLGQKCGISDPEVDAAIERASVFFGYYVNKGAIPYGEHIPWITHENNGKNSMAAMFFALQGNRPLETKFFAKMATAAYENREYGHTGQGFSYLWSALGANIGSPAAAAAFFKEASWHLDLVRRCDGSFTYDGGEQYGPGRTDDNTYYGKSGYNGLSPNATYVLTYALPLKKIYITGKEANQKNWLSRKDIDEAKASGCFDVGLANRSVSELIVALGDWSPIIRSLAAQELARRPEAKAMVTNLMSMAEGNNKWLGQGASGLLAMMPNLMSLAEPRNTWLRQGACEALGCIGTEVALPVYIRLLRSDDRWLRYKAANALKKMGTRAKPVLNEMLQAAVETAEPLYPVSKKDPIQFAQGELAGAIFGTGLVRDSYKTLDRAMLYPAIKAGALNPDGAARGQLAGLYENVLTLEDIRALGPVILESINFRCPADTMFGNDIRMAGVKMLAKYHFREDMDAIIEFAKTQGGWGSQVRTPELMKILLTYGSAAKGSIPKLKELIATFKADTGFPGNCQKMRIDSVEETIKAIEAAKDQPELLSLTEVSPSK